MSELAFPQPIGTSACERFRVWINQVEQCVLTAPVQEGAEFCSFAIVRLKSGDHVRIRSRKGINRASIHPKSRGVELLAENQEVSFMVGREDNYALQIDGKWCYLFHVADRKPSTENVIRFAAGFVYDVGELILESDTTLWIEPGAVVKGYVRAYAAENIHIGGGGILDGDVPLDQPFMRQIILDNCRNVQIHDITMIRPQGWMLVLGACDKVTIENLHEIGSRVSSDGIDIVGSRNVHIKGGFLRNNDDAIVVKSLDLRDHDPHPRSDFSENVENVLSEGVVIANDRAGNCFEIGHELRCETVKGITFRDCDILHCHGYGAVFSINNGDQAHVSDVLFEDIRVEHHYDKLISFRIIKSRYSKNGGQGFVSGVTFRRIQADESIFNAGYTTSQMGGYSPFNRIEHVRFEDFYFGGKKVLSFNDLDGYLRCTENVTFE